MLLFKNSFFLTGTYGNIIPNKKTIRQITLGDSLKKAINSSKNNNETTNQTTTDSIDLLEKKSKISRSKIISKNLITYEDYHPPKEKSKPKEKKKFFDEKTTKFLGYLEKNKEFNLIKMFRNRLFLESDYKLTNFMQKSIDLKKSKKIKFETSIKQSFNEINEISFENLKEMNVKDSIFLLKKNEKKKFSIYKAKNLNKDNEIEIPFEIKEISKDIISEIEIIKSYFYNNKQATSALNDVISKFYTPNKQEINSLIFDAQGKIHDPLTYLDIIKFLTIKDEKKMV